MSEKILQERFGHALGMATKAFKKRMGQNFISAGYDLSAEQGIVLIHLHHSGGMTQHDITELLECDKTNTTRIIDALESKGLVRRVPDRTDRRRKRVFVTDKGVRMYDTVGQMALKTQQQALNKIEAKKIKICREVLLKIQANLLED